MKKRNLVRLASIILASMAFMSCEETVGGLEDFLGNTETVTVTSIDDVEDYLDAASGGAIPAYPVTLKVNFELGWQTLLSAIERAGKYVALDISLCSMSDTEFSPVTEFDPGSYNTGERWIVSLALPNAAASIKAAGSYYANSTFRYFTALESVSGDYVQTIGNHAFRDCDALITVTFPAAAYIGNYAFDSCDALTTVSLPAAASIGDCAFDSCDALTTVSLPAAASIGANAFYHCTALTKVTLPKATTIGEYAFIYCDALTTVDLPAAATIGADAFYECSALTKVSLPSAAYIGADAFYNCDALTGVSLPSAAYIGNYAFYECDALTTVSLPATAPTLGTGMFGGISTARTVTVKVPSGATGYGTVPATYGGSNSDVCWGNGFRGKGWNGNGFRTSGSAVINSSITLTIEEQ